MYLIFHKQQNVLTISVHVCVCVWVSEISTSRIQPRGNSVLKAWTMLGRLKLVSTDLSKTWTPLLNSRHQKGDKTQVWYWGHKTLECCLLSRAFCWVHANWCVYGKCSDCAENIRRHRTLFSRVGDRLPRFLRLWRGGVVTWTRNRTRLRTTQRYWRGVWP